MTPDRLKSGATTADRSVATPSVTGRRRFGAILLAGVALLLATTNVFLLVDTGFHGKAYALVDAVARAAGMENVLANSPTEVNRRTVEVAARQSAEAATRQQAAATMALVANSLVLVDAHRALQQQHGVLQRTHGALSQTSKAVSHRVAIRTAAGATRSVTTLAGKALPYMGIASILALTAYDLADACQTLKDANELALAAGAEKVGEESTVCSLRVPSLDQVKAWTGGFPQ